MGNAERDLMQKIYDRFHCDMAAAVATTELTTAFLAALTANESGGFPDASCFELAIYERLKGVATGQCAAYGSINLEGIISAFDENFEDRDRKFRAWLSVMRPGPEVVRIITKSEDQDLRDLATSWGLTQIMGYHLIGSKIEIQTLREPGVHYRYAVNLLTDFARRFGLSLNDGWDSLFRCWNTGWPRGETADPEYVSKGLRRMSLYDQIA